MTAFQNTRDDKLVYLETDREDWKSEPFEYPQFYTPTKLAQETARSLQARLERNFPKLTRNSKGRMFGILVVEVENERLAYLSAYSGEFQDELESLPFVPPVYQLPKGEDFPEMAEINAIGKEIKSLERSDEYALLQSELKRINQETKEKIQAEKAKAKKARMERLILREEAVNLPTTEREALLEKLDKQGTQDGMDLRRFTRSENQRLASAEEALEAFKSKIDKLKSLRKAKSAELQEAIFRAYVFLNSKGERKDALSVFNDFGIGIPPAGAGECAAPKLFQYAFQHNLKPIALAEFWWGVSPDSEIREHGKFYPACKRKCEPILSFMLAGIKVKPNPMLENFGADKELETLLVDEHFVVVNKPAGLLSVPGKHIVDSVETRMQKKFPQATGPMIVHRLDQDTSGIMIIALSKTAHKLLQQQFLARTVRKTYVAILERAIKEESGVIDLPLILDIDNRPMQMVHYEYGKPAITEYSVLEKNASRTLIKMNPVTGRTHQLRVHCAHKSGLHAPILGDNLYGTRSDRLYLHAEQIEFAHPFTNKRISIVSERPFSI